MPTEQASPRTALYYSVDAYQETSARGGVQAGEQTGFMGRQVAGHEFLQAYLAHGTWSELVTVVPHLSCRESLYATCESHPSSRRRPRRLKIVEVEQFRATFGSEPPADILHFPCPPDPRFAWARESLGKPAFALSGVTHTLCSMQAVETLCQMLTAPFESYDRLIGTSRAVVQMAQTVTDIYGRYLQDRWGGSPQRRIQFELIPLGVDIEKFRPATPDEQFLGDGDTHVDSFVVKAFDGTSRTVNFTIHGANDLASISGAATSDLIENSVTNTRRAF
jgi:hypothetical protein